MSMRSLRFAQFLTLDDFFCKSEGQGLGRANQNYENHNYLQSLEKCSLGMYEYFPLQRKVNTNPQGRLGTSSHLTHILTSATKFKVQEFSCDQVIPMNN